MCVLVDSPLVEQHGPSRETQEPSARMESRGTEDQTLHITSTCLFYELHLLQSHTSDLVENQGNEGL